MEKIATLRDLLLQQTKGLYGAEKLQKETFEKLNSKVNSRELKNLIDKRVNETKNRVNRLDKVFTTLNVTPGAEKSPAIEGLIRETEEVVTRAADPDVLDAALLKSIQHISHYKIAGYGTAAAYAKTIGNADAEKLLHETAEEEKSFDKELTRLAVDKLNEKAKSPLT